MPEYTSSYAKNIIKRSLREIIDPGPSKKEKQTIWDYFGSECAYCGKRLHKGRREGHIDHLVPNGANQLYNRVLSCKECNGDEKRDKSWKRFLAQKRSNVKIKAKRKAKILQWQKRHKKPIFRKGVLSKVESLQDNVISYYERNVEKARRLRNKR